MWAAKKIYTSGVKKHIDVGSRIDGFIAHLLTFCSVDYVDIRPNNSSVPNLNFISASILDLPFMENSINSLSCLHVIEHIGLGRYGDKVDPTGYIKAAKELTRVLAREGKLYFSTPIGEEKVYFDAHRVFSPSTIINIFKDLKLEEFSFIDDKANEVKYNYSLDNAGKSNFGCGLFIFSK